jgi:hypothetical protein
MYGTPIQSLNNYEAVPQMQNYQDMQYGAMHNHQAEQAHNAAQTIQQAQHNNYYDIMEEYPQPDPPQQGQCPMNALAEDISNNIPNGTEYYDDLSDEEIINVQSSNGGLLSFIPEMLREPLLLLVVYVILSVPLVQGFFVKNIPQLSAGPNGVNIVGIVIYGTILVVAYGLAKRVLLK